MRRFKNLSRLAKWETVRDLWVQIGGGSLTLIMTFGLSDKANSIIAASIGWVAMLLTGYIGYVKKLQGKKEDIKQKDYEQL